MDLIKYTWDIKKSKINKKKHNISFEEAKSVFYDPNALLINDPDHSDSEGRFILFGLSYNLRILVVCHCYRKSETLIRIISARKAVKKEQKQYREKIL